MYKDWKRIELHVLVLYAIAFYIFIIRRSFHLSQYYQRRLSGLSYGSIFPHRLNDMSDAQWRNFRGNMPALTIFFGLMAFVSKILRDLFHLSHKGMSIAWLLISLAYLSYLHGACTLFIFLISSLNFILVKVFARTRYFPCLIWAFNIFFLVCNRAYNGYSFTMFGKHWAFLDKFQGGFRWYICFNFVVLRMISFGLDYHWADQDHLVHLKDRGVWNCGVSFCIYLCYLVYAPLYIAGPVISFNSFSHQLTMPQNSYAVWDMVRYGLRWLLSFFLLELLTHFFHYNSFVTSGLWNLLSPMDVFIIAYGVINFMWLKFFIIWRYFRFWSLACGIESPENMTKCVNNCYDLEGFWKNWHASYNKWLVRYMYIPFGGSQRKLLNVWVIFTFVAIWHDLEWKLLSWAWLTCLCFVPEMMMKLVANKFQLEIVFGDFLFRELRAVMGAVTITCLMVANLVGYVIGPNGINWLFSKFLTIDGMEALALMLITFYIGTKLMFHVRDAQKQKI